MIPEVVCYLVVSLSILIIGIPFLVFKKTKLKEISFVERIAESTDEILNNLVARYVHEEAAYNRGEMSEYVWRYRKNYLVNRYIDTKKQSLWRDSLNSMEEEKR